MDTKFSVAIHILAMISETADVLNSKALAESVGTNASYIRKVLALLKNANLITSHQGKAGYDLSRPASDISLLDIYYATQEVQHVTLFQVHQNTNPECPVGQNIEGAVAPLFHSVEAQLESQLAHQSLADVIANLYEQAGRKA
ncbi:Rrf2 family transcriptional regulator [Streptococcus hyointestinalis]|uniref:Rrf2 family transcriptional regulator n=1 Tax=Streptococcus hyointestinalis TaxID=1337 RepID=UPI0023F77885|nr:Rrf2 family transcriptional regulator [Streptococcus hyointestinalis]